MEYALKKLIVLGECCIEQGNAHLDTDIENEGPDSRIKNSAGIAISIFRFAGIGLIRM